MKTYKNIEMNPNSAWYEIITKTNAKLLEINFPEIIFSQIKDDDSYCKASAGIPSIYWAFAKDSEEAWIELEFKSLTINDKSYAQTNVYNCIKEKYKNSVKKLDGIIWNEDDSHVLRIKIYLQDKYFISQTEEWANAMVEFVQVFCPILYDCLSKVRASSDSSSLVAKIQISGR